MNDQEKKNLQITACRIRKGIVEAVYSAHSGHPGGSLSIADILAYLYFKELRIDPKTPDCPDRDRMVLSKGHCAPGLYSALAQRGYFPVEELKKFRHTNEMLQGHPDMKHTPGVDMTTGSLGLGVSAACGMALSGKISNKDYRVYAILGDGEIEEGQVWEASMFAAHYKLDNLCLVIDNNGLQIDGKICDVMNSSPIPEKFHAFGFHVVEINAHDFDQIESAFTLAKAVKDKPTAIILTSVKGKGVSYMENSVSWHGAAPNAEQYEIAMNELNAALAELEAK